VEYTTKTAACLYEHLIDDTQLLAEEKVEENDHEQIDQNGEANGEANGETKDQNVETVNNQLNEIQVSQSKDEKHSPEKIYKMGEEDTNLVKTHVVQNEDSSTLEPTEHTHTQTKGDPNTVEPYNDATYTKDELISSCLEMLEISRLNLEAQLRQSSTQQMVVQLTDVHKLIGLW